MVGVWENSHSSNWHGYDRKEELKRHIKTGDLIQIRRVNQPKQIFPFNMIEHWGVAIRRDPITDTEFTDGKYIVSLI